MVVGGKKSEFFLSFDRAQQIMRAVGQPRLNLSKMILYK